MIVSSGLMLLPTDFALDTERDNALSDDDLIGRQSTTAADAEAQSVSAPDINEIAPDLALRTERRASSGFGPIARGVIKPLIALATAQYVIVAALLAGLAFTVSHHASDVINEKFAAIITALKRL